MCSSKDVLFSMVSPASIKPGSQLNNLNKLLLIRDNLSPESRLLLEDVDRRDDWPKDMICGEDNTPHAYICHNYAPVRGCYDVYIWAQPVDSMVSEYIGKITRHSPLFDVGD